MDALFEAEAKLRPFVGRQDARQHVERDQPLGGIRLAVDREGDADAPEQELGLAAAMFQHVGRQVAQPVLEARIDRPHPAARFRHFVECNCHSCPCGRTNREPRVTRAKRSKLHAKST